MRMPLIRRQPSTSPHSKSSWWSQPRISVQKIPRGSLIFNGHYEIAAPNSNGKKNHSQRYQLIWQPIGNMNRSCQGLQASMEHKSLASSKISTLMTLSHCSLEMLVIVGTGFLDSITRKGHASDRLSRCEMAQVPQYIKYYWAKELRSIRTHGKKRRNLTALKEMWPMVKVGRWDMQSKTMIDYEEVLEDEYGSIEPVKRLITDEEAETLSINDFLEAFDTVTLLLILSKSQC